ncbi:hypothetical protein FRC00_002980 [Tulasnella sp. 408]|nr:hypothetical protein FRC00_002980 [Tulasnella sp. 408]
MSALPAVLLDLNYTDEKRMKRAPTNIEHFQRNFVSPDVTRAFGQMNLEDHGDKGVGGEDWETYMKQLQQMANRRRQAPEIDFEDVSKSLIWVTLKPSTAKASLASSEAVSPTVL